MCTLGGYFTLHPSSKSKIDTSILTPIFSRIDVRGRDQFGWLYDDASYGFRKFISGAKSDLLPLSSLPRSVMALGRAIPAAERVAGPIQHERDTQPFHNGLVAVAHNGIIANDEEIQQKYKIERVSPVDTSILPDLFTNIGVHEGIGQIKGSFALTVIDRRVRSLFLTTNFMPLLVYEKDGVVYWASDERQLPMGRQIPYYTVNVWNGGEFRSTELQNSLSKKKVIVVCSGGLDSTTTLKLYKVLGYDVSMLHILYGQAAEEPEDWATTKIAEMYDIPKYRIDARSIIQQLSVASPLLGQKPRGNRHWDMESTYSYVGARNMIFTTFAMSLAERIGAGIVSLGLNIDDSTYPDNNITYLNEMSKAGCVSLNWNARVKVTAPFVHLTKKEIVEVGLAIGAPFHMQTSCYYPKLEGGKIINCGKCGCDKLREYSFKALGYIDPVEYDEKPDWEQNKVLPDSYFEEDVPRTTGFKDIPYLEYMNFE